MTAIAFSPVRYSLSPLVHRAAFLSELDLMIGKSPLWVIKQHGHRPETMFRAYAAWTQGAPESDESLRVSRFANPVNATICDVLRQMHASESAKRDDETNNEHPTAATDAQPAGEGMVKGGATPGLSIQVRSELDQQVVQKRRNLRGDAVPNAGKIVRIAKLAEESRVCMAAAEERLKAR